MTCQHIFWCRKGKCCDCHWGNEGRSHHRTHPTAQQCPAHFNVYNANPVWKCVVLKFVLLEYMLLEERLTALPWPWGHCFSSRWQMLFLTIGSDPSEQVGEDPSEQGGFLKILIWFQDQCFAFPPVLPGGVVVGLVPVGAVGEGEVVAEVPPAPNHRHQASNC